MNHTVINTINFQFHKLAASLGFIAVLAAIIIAWNTPAINYESSIYLSTPLITWVLLLIGFGLGVWIVLSKTGEKKPNDKDWLIGLLLIGLVSLVILSLPMIRNYFFWDGSGDVGGHLGTTQDLLASGHTTGNLYPIIHILLAQISLVLGIEAMTLFRWALLLFIGLSFISVYYVCRELLSIKRQMAIATLVGYIFLQEWYIGVSPNTVGNMLFPFFIFVLIKVIKATAQTFQWAICLILLVILIVPLHPVPSLAFLLIAIAMWLWYKVKSRDRNNKPPTFKVLGIPFVLLITAWALMWFSSFGIWNATIQAIYRLVTEGGKTHFQDLANQATYATQYGYSVFAQFIKVYGDITIYLLLAGSGFIILQRRTSKNYGSYLLNPIGWAIVMILMAIITMYFGNIVFGPQRLLAYIIFLSLPVVGITLGSFLDSPNWLCKSRLVRFICTGLLLIILSTSAVLKLYPSPYVLSVSLQNTRSEITGMDWFLHNKDENIFSNGWYYYPWVYSSYLLTSEERKGRNDLSPYVNVSLPDRLGYDKNPELGQSYEKDVYLVMTELVRKLYVDTFPKMASLRLTDADLNRLENDPSVNKLYSTNKGFDIYFVQVN